MTELTFREILERKMGPSREENPVAPSTENPLPERLCEFSLEILSLHIERPRAGGMIHAYPKTKSPSKTSPPPPVFPMESRVKKSDLDDISLGKWSRFEKMAGSSLGESTTKKEVLQVFRRFLRRNHPDLAAQNGAALPDFALAVKIKEELLRCLK